MSFILDALRKSELARQRQSGPSIAELPIARGDRRLPAALVAIGLLLLVNVAVLLYFLLREDAPAAANTPAASVAAANVEAPPEPQSPAPPPEPARAAEAAVALDVPPPGPEAAPAPDPTLLPAPSASTSAEIGDETPPPPAAIGTPPQGAAGLAELSVDLHIYTDDPARRAVFINGRRYTEGMTLAEGPVVEEINRDGAVINHRGQRFLLPRN